MRKNKNHNIFKNLASSLAFLIVGLISVYFAFSVSQFVLKRAYSQQVTTENNKQIAGVGQPVQQKELVKKSLQVNPKENEEIKAQTNELNKNNALEVSTKVSKNKNNQLAVDLTKQVILEKDSDKKIEVSKNKIQIEESDEFDLFLEPYNYDPSDRRNPFQRIDKLSATSGGTQRPLLPLENYNLSQLKLLGVIWNVSDARAMIKDPTGRVHVLIKDQRIGRNQGYIADIRDSEVVVVEAREENGELIYTTKILKIN